MRSTPAKSLVPLWGKTTAKRSVGGKWAVHGKPGGVLPPPTVHPIAIGNAVVNLICSIAKLDETSVSGAVAIRRR
jgi:hypothetical protein